MTHYSRVSTLFYLTACYSNFLATGNALPFPRRVQIQTTTLCNGKCLFCPYKKLSGTLKQGVMEESLFYKIADELNTAHYFSEAVFELHNEPLVDERTFQFIHYVKTRSHRLACTLVTNGQRIDSYSLSEIRNSKVDRIIVSLNAHCLETYERISGLDFKRIENNIDTMLAETDLRQKLILSFVITDQTLNEIRQALRYWNERGIRTAVNLISNRAGTLEDFESMRVKNEHNNFPFAETFRMNLITKIRHLSGCYLPFLDMNILFNGDVILCCQDWQRTVIVGNANEFSLKEIWNSNTINKIRELIIKKKYFQIPLCSNCSLVKK